jgi:hypothetical protein
VKPALRPAHLPAEAVWQFDAGEWVVCPRNAQGEYHGKLRSYRADGTPSVECEFVDGRRHGAFRVFHPSGSVAREGRYVEDRPDGVLLVRTDGERELHVLRECCVPDGARVLRQEYGNGALELEAFFDRDGRQLMPDGALCPERPLGVGESAIFDVTAREWVVSARRSGGARDGLGQRFTESGVLVEEVTWRDDRRHGPSRRWSSEGVLCEEQAWLEGLRHGPYRGRVRSAHERTVVVQGAFERGHPVGSFRVETETGEGIVRELGRAVTEAMYRESAAFEDRAHDADHFGALAARFRSEGRPGEALAASARRLAKTLDLRAFLEEVEALVLPVEVALEGSPPEEPLSRVLTTWLLGGSVESALRELGRLFGATHRAGLDFMSAALLLEPDDRALRLRRAEARFELGDAAGLSDDLASLDAAEREVVMLRQRAAVLYAGFGFAPAEEEWVERVPEGLPPFAELDVSRITVAMRKIMTRLGLVREALLEACARSGLFAPTFLPPETAGPGGLPVPLERSTFLLEEDGAEIPIIIDETLSLAGLGIPELLEQALLDWTAFCFLAWAAGLDEPAIPTELHGRDEFERALATSLERCRLFQECLKSPSKRKEHPGESFRGMPLPELTGPVLSFAAAYYREIRAVLFYLTDPECRSLWQDDLRPV